MRYLVLAAGLFAVALASATEAPRSDRLPCLVPRDCFRTHVAEAMAMNRERANGYAAESAGRTRLLSHLLVGVELATLPAAYFFDRLALRFQERGIPVLCDEFMPMSDTPPFVARMAPPAVIPDDIENLRELRLVGDLNRALAVSHAALAARAEAWLHSIADVPAFRCLVRHFLESIRRAALLSPRHEVAARAHGVTSPRHLVTMFLAAQIQLLPLLHRLDRLAAPFQAEGIPILCRDVPPIPAP